MERLLTLSKTTNSEWDVKKVRNIKRQLPFNKQPQYSQSINISKVENIAFTLQYFLCFFAFLLRTNFTSRCSIVQLRVPPKGFSLSVPNIFSYPILLEKSPEHKKATTIQQTTTILSIH